MSYTVNHPAAQILNPASQQSHISFISTPFSRPTNDVVKNHVLIFPK